MKRIIGRIALFALVVFLIGAGALFVGYLNDRPAEAAYGDSQGDRDFFSYFGKQIDLEWLEDLFDSGVTATEFDTLDGLTSTAAELNILDGATVNTTELNILDGATVNTTELNLLDGLTADYTELNVLDGSDVSATEMGYINSVTSDVQTQLTRLTPIVTAKTTLTTIGATSGTLIYTNTGDADGVVINLPALSSWTNGDPITFCQTAADGSNFDVEPNGTDRILQLTNANGDGIRSTGIGNCVELTDVGGYWGVTGIINSTWVDKD